MSNPVTKRARKIDYNARAGLFQGRGRHRGKGLQFRGFGSAALAIQFAVEDMHPSHSPGAILEVDEDRFDMLEILAFYHDAHYPFVRTVSKSDNVQPIETQSPQRFQRMSAAAVKVRV